MRIILLGVTPVEMFERQAGDTHFCIIGGRVIIGMSLIMASKHSQYTCTLLCATMKSCYSANFYETSGICELGNREESMQVEKLTVSDDGIHISQLFCDC